MRGEQNGFFNTLKISMKKCPHCNKSTENFGKNKSKSDGLQVWCRECTNITSKIRSRTKKGIISKMYAHQRQTSKKRCHKLPNYSNVELREWCFKQDKFHCIYQEYVKSGFNTKFIPSCDRIINSEPYKLENIQLVTWLENYKRSHQDNRVKN